MLYSSYSFQCTNLSKIRFRILFWKSKFYAWPLIVSLTIFNNVSPLPCSHPACSEFSIHLEFLPEIVCKVGKVCKVEKVRSTFHTFHDYLNFYGEKKDDRLFTIYYYLSISLSSPDTSNPHLYIHRLFLKMQASGRFLQIQTFYINE